jgi:hypothetical protein
MRIPSTMICPYVLGMRSKNPYVVKRIADKYQ